MSSNPRRNLSRLSHRESPPSRSNAGRLLLLALFLFGALLVTTLLGRLLLERQLALRPTPTITRSPANTDTPTVDFRATINIAEVITQEAVKAAQAGRITPTRDVTLTPTPTEAPVPSEETATPLPSLFVPVVAGEINPTDTPAPTVTPTIAAVEIETPTPHPGEATQTAVADETATALLFTPTATDTPVPTATPTQSIVGAPPVATLQAVTKATLPIYAGPGVLYSVVASLPPGLTLRLEGRTTSGEWVHLCCVNNVDGWVRQASLTITGNRAPAGAPADANGNDVRWLALQQTNAQPLTPLTTATEMPSAHFPLFRRDSGAMARVDARFTPPFNNPWQFTNQAAAGASFSSPPVVVGSLVIAASADSHLYGFDKIASNQRFKIVLDSIVNFTPAVQDAYIYLFDQSGRVSALRATGNEADLYAWDTSLGTAPQAALNLRGDLLFAVGQNRVLYALERLNNGRTRWTFSDNSSTGPAYQYPAIGDQLIYLGGLQLTALDIYSGTTVWQDTSVNSVAAPPVYSMPGVRAVAEVYAADFNGIIHALDANTGAPFWRKASQRNSNDRPTALAVDERAVYASGPGFVSAKNRLNGDDLWRIDFDANGLLGGPIVGNGRLLIAGVSGGAVQVLDSATGQFVASLPIVESLVGSPAVSDGWIYFAARNGRIYAITESR